MRKILSIFPPQRSFIRRKSANDPATRGRIIISVIGRQHETNTRKRRAAWSSGSRDAAGREDASKKRDATKMTKNTASSPTAAKRRKREDNENNETTTRFSPTLHLEERAETEVTVAPDKQPVDVHLHPHQSIAIEGSCGVKVTSAVVCINGYLARCDHPEQYCRASRLVGNAVTVRSGALGAEIRLTPLPLDDELCVAVKGGEDVEMPKEELKAVILAKGKGFLAERFQRIKQVSHRKIAHLQREHRKEKEEKANAKGMKRNLSSFELVSLNNNNDNDNNNSNYCQEANKNGEPEVPEVSPQENLNDVANQARSNASNEKSTTSMPEELLENTNGTLARNKIPEDWARAGTAAGDTVRQLSRDPKGPPAVIAFIGPKGVGKSTFARYVANLLMIDYEKVGFLDIDPGQPERTAPGLVSVTTLLTPLIGPPALRLSGGGFLGSGEKPFFQKFIGDYSPESDIDAYVDACVECLDKWLEKMKEERSTNRTEALLINCNGWVKGAGLEALAKFLDRVPNLTKVLNVQSHVERRNCPGGAFWNVKYSKDINNDNSSEGGIEKRDIASFDGCMSFPDKEGTAITYVSAGAQGRNDDDEMEGEKQISKRSPQESRALIWLAWAKQVVARHAGRPECGGLRLTNEATAFAEIAKGLEQATPWRVSLDDVKIKVLFSDIPNKNDALKALNASVVGLLLEDESCVGLAVVRSVNEADNCVFLLSNVEEDVIREVKTLCLGKVALPMRLKGVLNGSSPYAAVGVVANDGTGGAEQKSRNNIARGAASEKK